MSHSTCFSKILADVFALWHCVNSHQKAPDQQTVNTWAFIEVLTLADDLLLTLLIYMEPHDCIFKAEFLLLLYYRKVWWDDSMKLANRYLQTKEGFKPQITDF